jgi:hypothetical protein
MPVQTPVTSDFPDIAIASKIAAAIVNFTEAHGPSTANSHSRLLAPLSDSDSSQIKKRLRSTTISVQFSEEAEKNKYVAVTVEDNETS